MSTLERDLALQLQIAEAARCLSREENLTKQVRKRRKSAVLKEEKKLKDLEQALNEYRLAARHLTPLRANASVLEGKLGLSRDLVLLAQTLGLEGHWNTSKCKASRSWLSNWAHFVLEADVIITMYTGEDGEIVLYGHCRVGENKTWPQTEVVHIRKGFFKLFKII